MKTLVAFRFGESVKENFGAARLCKLELGHLLIGLGWRRSDRSVRHNPFSSVPNRAVHRLALNASSTSACFRHKATVLLET